jgi:hypothetical protein
MEIYLTGLTHTTKTSAAAILLKLAPNSADTSTGTAYGDVYTFTITLKIAGLVLGDDADHTLVLPLCDVECAIKEGEPDTISGSFTCSGLPSFT